MILGLFIRHLNENLPHLYKSCLGKIMTSFLFILVNMISTNEADIR